MLVNSKMLAGTGLESLCEIADDATKMKLKAISLFNTEFDQKRLLARSEILQKWFSDDENAKKLIWEVWGL
jgi:dihydroorotate dehydrogenase